MVSWGALVTTGTAGQTVPSTDRRWWIFVAIQCGNFVVYMDAFIVTLALPAMARDFGVGIHVIKWAVVSYLGALTVTLLVAGRLADLFGRGRVTIVGIALHTLAALLCAAAPTLSVLLALRVLQGLGGALVLANVMAEITAVFPPQERRLAMAINASVLALAQVTGLLVGGLFIGWLGWRAVFLVAVAVGALGVALDVSLLPRDRPASAGRGMDWMGAVLSILVVGAPFLLVERMARDVLDPAGLAALFAAAALVALFILVERRSTHPLLEPSLFRSRAFSCGAAAAACYFMASVTCYFLVPLYAQVVLGRTPFAAGVLLLPLSLALVASSQLTSSLARGLSTRLVSTAGLVCVAVSMVLMSTYGAGASYLYIAGPLVLLGVGAGMFQSPNNAAVLAGVPPEHLGVANGAFATARNFGQAIGASLAAEILAGGLGPKGAVDVLSGGPSSAIGGLYLQAYVRAQAHAFEVAAGLGVVGVLLSALRGAEVRRAEVAPAVDRAR